MENVIDVLAMLYGAGMIGLYILWARIGRTIRAISLDAAWGGNLQPPGKEQENPKNPLFFSSRSDW